MSKEPTPYLAHALFAFLGASLAIIALAQLGGAVGFIAANLSALVAVIFLYVPAAYAWRRGEELADYGFCLTPYGKNTIAIGVILLVVFPLFIGGYIIFHGVVCSESAGILSELAQPGLCSRWRGPGGIRVPALDLAFAELVLVQFVVVALPEELFFRGFLHQHLERAIPPKRRLWGGGIGWALIISSALFALGHLTVEQDPRQLAVFFPGLLFGWVRSATGSITAGVAVHAFSNLLLELLARAFF